jgi:hypothetical protein
LRRALIPLLTAIALFVAAGAVGYFTSFRLGQRILRQEAVQQLATLLHGEVSIDRVRLVIHLGVRLEGENVRAYPGPGGHALEARQVVADVDVLSLLLGRFRLRRLWVQGAHIRIERNAAGEWSPYPIAALDRLRSSRPRGDPEPALGPPRAFESVTRFLLERARIASLVELRDGSATLVDWMPRGARATPVTLRFDEFQGSLDHRWLSRDQELRLRGSMVGDSDERTRIEAEGQQLAAGGFRLTLAATDLDLELFRPYAQLIGPEADLSGQLSGVLSFETPAPGSGVVEADWMLSEFAAGLPRGGSRARIESPGSQVEARLEIHPGRVRLSGAKIRGQAVEVDISGVIERPLRESSMARLTVALRDAELELVRRFIDSLPPSDRDPLMQMLERVESGRIARIGGNGTTRLAEWRRLFAGELAVLPAGFTIGAEVDGLSAAIAETDRLTELRGSVEWSGDRISMREISSSWNETPLPTTDIVVEGVSHLFEAPEEVRRLRQGARPLPGLGALIQVLRELGSGEEGPSQAPPIHLEIDEIHHPALRWPVEEASLSIEPIERGVQMTVARGKLSGAPIQGEAVWLREPEQRLSLSLEAHPWVPEEEKEPVALAGDLPPTRSLDEWASGRFRVSPAEGDSLGFTSFSGHFALRLSTLLLSEVRAELEPTGWLEGHAAIELDQPEQFSPALSLHLVDGDLSRLFGTFGLPPELATGRLKLAGSLEGVVHPGTPVLSNLAGFASLVAVDGELRKKLPLVLAMAQATEGFNPFAAREAVSFETIESVLRFEGGIVSTEEFMLEGPMRVFASGELDLSQSSGQVDAVVGVFLFRQADRVLGNLPLVKNLISDKGMVGAYFELTGPLEDPKAKALPGKTLSESMPSVIKAPFKVLQFLLAPPRRQGRMEEDGDADGAPAAPPDPVPGP